MGVDITRVLDEHTYFLTTETNRFALIRTRPIPNSDEKAVVAILDHYRDWHEQQVSGFIAPEKAEFRRRFGRNYVDSSLGVRPHETWYYTARLYREPEYSRREAVPVYRGVFACLGKSLIFKMQPAMKDGHIIAPEDDLFQLSLDITDFMGPSLDIALNK